MKLTSPKKISFDSDAINPVLEGARIIAEAVSSTMGPKGNLVTYQDPGSLWPVATKDGVSVARKIFLKDPEQNLGAMMVMQSANRQLYDVGDGTTLTTLLAYLFLEYVSSDPEVNIDKLEVKIDEIIQHLEDSKLSCDTVEKVTAVATIASNGDVELGDMIGRSVFDVGTHGLVLCEKSLSNSTSVEKIDGYQFDSGIEYPVFINSIQKVAYEDFNPLILVTDHEIAWGRQLIPLLERLAKTPEYTADHRPIVIFSPSIRDEALSMIIKNYTAKVIYIVPIHPQGIGIERQHCLLDIAAITGATYISEESGIRLEDVQFSHLGRCEKITSKRGKTILIGSSPLREKRLELLKLTSESVSIDDYERKIVSRSMAKISGAISIIKVGGYSETEQNERMDRVDDAIRASRAALESGVVAGGGIALFNAYAETPVSDNHHFHSIFRAPMEKIFRTSFKDFDTDRVALNKKMIDAGIFDPFKVVKFALLNAFSVAKTLGRTKVLITPIEEK